VNSETVTPQNLFDKPVRYVVPLFQRPYVWEKEKQWKPLWDDISRTAEAFDALVAAGAKTENARKEVAKHFLGAVVVQSVTGSSKYIPERFVIDGQQRLTTLQLIIATARTIVEAEGMAQAGAILDGLVRNEAKYHSVADDEFKVWPTNFDRPMYRELMALEGDVNYKGLSQPTTRLAEAHQFFAGRIADWVASEGDPVKRERMLDSLVTTLRDLLEIVEITLQESENSQVIFETLNDRGTPLQASDLVKNFLFQEIEASGGNSETLYGTYWLAFDTEPWRRKMSQGRLYRPRVDVFLQHWLVLRTKKDVTATDIFATFRTHAQRQEDEAPAVLADLSRAGETWDGFDHQEPHSRVGTFVYRQRVMQADSLGPVLLWLFDFASPTPANQLTIALDALESWLVRRMLCRLTTKDYNSLYVELLTQLAETDSSDRGTAIQAFLLGQTADSREWPTDVVVTQSLTNLPLYRLLTRARLRMVLEGIEDHLRGTKSEEPVVRGKLTIEHVMPQGWHGHWPLPASAEEGEGAEKAAAKREVMIHTIGNLTLLTQSLNSGISNSPWDDKRKAIEKYGVLRLSAPLKAAEKWDEASITVRSEELADVVCRVWGRPKG
jgi:hypothetical protein